MGRGHTKNDRCKARQRSLPGGVMGVLSPHYKRLLLDQNGVSLSSTSKNSQKKRKREAETSAPYLDRLGESSPAPRGELGQPARMLLNIKEIAAERRGEEGTARGGRLHCGKSYYPTRLTEIHVLGGGGAGGHDPARHGRAP